MDTLPFAESFRNKNWLAIRRLTDLRNDLAQKTGQERFKILQNKTIDFIAESMPQTLKELEGIKGIGPKKLKELGPAILAITKGESSWAFKKEEEKNTQFTETGEVIFSVREFLSKVNSILYSQNVSVCGEIVTIKLHTTGVYITLKDESG
ncbi:MAG: HRDC domain-containing protein, partial [Patescibacteria group bacterium]